MEVKGQHFNQGFRRILRIWPLYFLICLLGFLIFPIFGWFGTYYGDAAHQILIQTYLWPYLLFVGNWAASLHAYPTYHLLQPLWTISLEEQYYLIGPVLLVLARFEKRPFLNFPCFFWFSPLPREGER